MASIPESFESDEISEVSSISSTDSEPLPKTPKTLNDSKRFLFRGEEFMEIKNVAKQIGKGKVRKTSSIWKLGREVKRISDGKTH